MKLSFSDDKNYSSPESHVTFPTVEKEHTFFLYVYIYIYILLFLYNLLKILKESN
jgi:ATP/ADP translocase